MGCSNLTSPELLSPRLFCWHSFAFKHKAALWETLLSPSQDFALSRGQAVRSIDIFHYTSLQEPTQICYFNTICGLERYFYFEQNLGRPRGELWDTAFLLPSPLEATTREKFYGTMGDAFKRLGKTVVYSFPRPFSLASYGVMGMALMLLSV